MADRDFTAKINVDISELKKSMKEAKQQAAMANAEFETVAATMDDWTKSSEGLAAKLKALEKTLNSQESVLSVYEASLADARAEYDKNGKKIDALKAKLQDLAKKGISKTSDEYSQLETDLKSQIKTLEKYERQLKNQQRSYDDNSKKVDQLKAKLQQLAKDGVSETSEEYQKYQTELTKAEKAQERNQSKIDDLNAKIVTQKDVVSKAQSAFDAYAGELNDTEKEYSDLTAKQDATKTSIDDLSLKIQNQKTDIAETQKAMSDYSDEADELGKSVDEAGDKAEKSSDGFTVMKGALADLVAYGIEKALEGLKQLSDKIIDIGKQSLGNYAEYEQLVGGVETLFKDSADIVQGYADNAFKSAGLSANDYMETVTSFSASLLQGLNGDTAKAAKIADMAIVDMSDNANKMGTDMASIQNAYQGFAKQNYTMLDNLKLGYGGTQEEMARLINDSGVLGDTMEVTEKNVNKVSFDKIIEAIHVIQDEMDITGTTSKEAADTIEGSKNAMQASFQNLLTGLANEDADLDSLFDNFISSAETYFGNVMPRIKMLIERGVQFAKDKLTEKFPEAMAVFESIVSFFRDKFLPVIRKVFEKLAEVIKNVFGWIIDNKDVVIAALAGIGAAIVAWNIATVVTNIMKMVKAIKAMGAASAFAAAKQWLLNTALLSNPIALVVAAIAGLVTAFVVLWKKSEAFRNFWKGLWDKIKKAFSGFVSAWGEGFDIIKEGLSKVGDFFKGIWDAIQESARNLIGNVVSFFTGAWEKIKEAWNAVGEFFSGIWDAIQESASNLIENVVGFFTGAWEAIKTVWQVVSGWFKDTIIQPVTDFFKGMWDGIKTLASSTWDGIKTVWNAVSGWFEKTIITPVTTFFSGMWDGLKTGASKAWRGIKSVFASVPTWFEDKFTKAWQAVKDVFSTGGKIFDGIKDGIVSAFKTVVNAIIRGINKVISIPFNAINDILDNIRNVTILKYKPFEDLISPFDVPQIPELKQGGVLKRGQVGLLEGDGAEAVVPLENNKKWIAATASDLKKALESEGIIGGGGTAGGVGGTTYNFNQYNTSPKALSRLEIYRQSKNLLKLRGAT